MNIFQFCGYIALSNIPQVFPILILIYPASPHWRPKLDLTIQAFSSNPTAKPQWLGATPGVHTSSVIMPDL